MNIDSASTITNFISTTTVAGFSTSSAAILKNFTGTYFSDAAVPLSNRPTAGITYPRFN